MSDNRGLRWDVEMLFPVIGSSLPSVIRGPVVVSMFDDVASAEEDCARREREARQGVNPFRVSKNYLATLTSLGDLFSDWLLDAGMGPPPGDEPDWTGWFDSNNSNWDDAQFELLWQGLDRLRFFRIVERPSGRKAYLVSHLQFDWPG
jgi:hypothetical protein